MIKSENLEKYQSTERVCLGTYIENGVSYRVDLGIAAYTREDFHTGIQFDVVNAQDRIYIQPAFVQRCNNSFYYINPKNGNKQTVDKFSVGTEVAVCQSFLSNKYKNFIPIFYNDPGGYNV